ncbi:Mitochondrial distribution and morphology protein 10 [Tulasnella sp. 419]|nr:Mitochondrial distribution and morphology protein 10 [Tulasnella sp. 419]
MHPFANYVLQSYYKATGWNEDNLYSNLTRSSTALLDFTLPRGLKFNISKSPNSLFRTTYSMNALPSLKGSVGYIFTSCDLDVKGSNSVRFKDMIERFKVYDAPRRPEGKEEVWQGGERVDTRDYLLYGQIYVPTSLFNAVYSVRLSPTLQASIAAISNPIANQRPSLASSQSRIQAAQQLAESEVQGDNLMLSLQHDTGRWCSEYTYSADDGMFGARVLANVGRRLNLNEPTAGVGGGLTPTERVKRVDEEDAMEGGLKGRFSVGAEVYYNAKKIGGVSTGIRFTTIPDATPPSFQAPSSSSSAEPHSPIPSQPPTTLTATYNPIMGHISTAYAARVSQDLSLCSRFDFNIYSYDSEWTMGAEWWMRRTSFKGKGKETDVVPKTAQGSIPVTLADHQTSAATSPPKNEVNGVVKARMSTNTDVSIMWEGRLRNTLVSLGVVSDFANRSRPIRSIGLEIAYFSSE